MIEGVKQELLDCNFEALHDVKVTSCASEAFEDSDFNICMTLIPKLSHMSIADWLYTNAKVYQEFGKAIESGSKRTARTLIAKGPVNSNSLVL
jgi:malate/lactate dehydrogenase